MCAENHGVLFVIGIATFGGGFIFLSWLNFLCQRHNKQNPNSTENALPICGEAARAKQRKRGKAQEPSYKDCGGACGAKTDGNVSEHANPNVEVSGGAKEQEESAAGIPSARL